MYFATSNIVCCMLYFVCCILYVAFILNIAYYKSLMECFLFKAPLRVLLPADFRKGTFRRVQDCPLVRRPHIAYMGEVSEVTLTSLTAGAHIAFGAGSIEEHDYLIYAVAQAACDHLVRMKNDPAGGGKRMRHHKVFLSDP